ncbi:MAG TPA: glycosyltransferase family 2 protein [Desulfitobacterium dehalogenans]|uniref:Glycosyltransferase family 2 protein n=1 Tax=Desulfitobacterium dehalogenans TaxID=36854 RepID=A0A7C6Z4I3_9FIRM|nr:glycosyltransferase family 2 protein [Desulfitobacterium dehalogenans]
MITILMGTYNGEKFITEQIESILCQTEDNWKLIIQDDCSTDAMVSILQSYVTNYPHKITLIQREFPSGSAKNNFISMLKFAKSEYIMTCDQDDIWLPSKIELTLKKMHESEGYYGKDKPLLVHTDLKIVDEKLEVIAESMFHYQSLDSKRDKFNNLLVQNIVTGCTIMFNRRLLEMVYSVPEESIMHDWWFALVAAAFGKIGFVNEPTILYRQHSSNEVGAKNANSILYNIKRLSNKEQTKLTIQSTYNQATSFLRLYEKELTEECLKIVNAYISIPDYGKLKRINILSESDFWKTGLMRKCGQILLI